MKPEVLPGIELAQGGVGGIAGPNDEFSPAFYAVSYTHLRAHETVLDLVCRLLLEKKKYSTNTDVQSNSNLSTPKRLYAALRAQEQRTT